MARALIIALSSVLAASAATASTQSTEMSAAPAGSPQTRYCLRVEPQTGSRIESIECWTREEWAEGGVDVDKDWAKDGVRILNA